MKLTTNYISCASNCHPHAIDWSKNNNIICYASSNSVVIYDPDYLETGRVINKLEKHQSQVKIVEWINKDIKDDKFQGSEILSASLDGTIIIWSESNEKNNYKPTSIFTLDNDLSTAHAAYWSPNNNNNNNNNNLLIAGSSFKDIFKIWYRKSDSIINQRLDFKKNIPNEIKITSLPGDKSIPAIIICLDDATINFYTWSINNNNDDYDNINITKLNFNKTIELKGHKDWIQCLDIIKYNNNNEMFMATGSQDCTIRLWKISSILAKDVDNEQRYQFKVGDDDNYFDICMESVLTGHDHWVYGVHWSPYCSSISNKNNKRDNNLKLLSSGLDQTIIIWEASKTGVWIETVKFGKVGGNSLGFYGSKFNYSGTSVIAQGYQGTFNIWKYNNDVKKWYPRSGPTGHFDQVTDLQWEPRGRYLLTTSLDQTTRIHVEYSLSNLSNSSNSFDKNWHEISRPQIHGYDINCLTILNSNMFCSGADEKVIRVFKAPPGFSEALENNDWSKVLNITDSSASVPALGLTNKTQQQYLKNLNNSDDIIKRPPTEEELIRYTLWPELEKLYGHGYELFSIAARNDGKLIATGSKSSSSEHSGIILWSCDSWAQIGKLINHRLTVTQLKFSPNGKYLLSVSRDRRWSIFKSDDNYENYNLLASSPVKSLHTRIIWCCSWSHDSKYFVTGSRDGKIGLWSREKLDYYNINNESSIDLLPTGSFEFSNASVTALDFYHKFIDDCYVLAVGFEDGTIQLHKITIKNNDTVSQWISIINLDNQQAHHKTVKKLSFRPSFKDNNCEIELASCGADKTVKIFKFLQS